jgi:hypothetical protein
VSGRSRPPARRSRPKGLAGWPKAYATGAGGSVPPQGRSSRAIEPARRKADQEPEAVGAGLAGVRACPPLLRQVLTQEAAEVAAQSG